jgi:undecaprenyl-diphosphatase
MNYKLWFWIVNIVSTALRFLIIGKTDLNIGKVHFQLYTKFLDFSYFDHSLFVAYLTKASTFIFGNNEFAVRFPAVLIFFFVCWIFFICAKKLYNEKTAFIGVLLLNVLPIFSLLGFAIIAQDFLFILFWISALLAFIILTETDNKNYWYLLGVITGLAMLSRYNAVLILFSIFMFLIFSPSHRFWFKRKEPYFAIIIPALMFLPVIIQNIENNSAPFRFQLNLGISLRTQICCLSPLLFLIFFAAAFLCVKKAYQKKDRIAMIITCFSLPALLPFKGPTNFNGILPFYTVAGYLILSIYVAHLMLKLWYIKWFRVYSYAAWGIALFMIITASLHVLYNTIPTEKFLPHDQNEKKKCSSIIPETERIDISSEVYGWKDVLISEKDLQQEFIEFDHSVFKFINSNLKSKFLDFYISLISYCDSKNFNLSFFAILTISLAILWNNKRECFWTTLIILVSTIAIGSLITFPLKYYFERPRPLKVFGDKNVNIFFEKSYNNSFPSGHTQIAFSVCTFMFMMVRKYWYWYIILALGTSFERIYAGYHFPFDVLVGAVIGMISAYVTVALFRKYSKIKI